MQTQQRRRSCREEKLPMPGHPDITDDKQNPRYCLLSSRETCDAEELCGPLKEKRLALVTEFPFVIRNKLLIRLMQIACQGPIENASVIITAARNESRVPRDALTILDDVARAACEKVSESGLLLGYSLRHSHSGGEAPDMKAEFVLQARLRKVRRIGGRRLDDSDAIIVCGTDQPGPENARDKSFDLPSLRAIGALIKGMPCSLRLLHPLSAWKFEATVSAGQEETCMETVERYGVAAKFSERVRSRRL